MTMIQPDTPPPSTLWGKPKKSWTTADRRMALAAQVRLYIDTHKCSQTQAGAAFGLDSRDTSKILTEFYGKKGLSGNKAEKLREAIAAYDAGDDLIKAAESNYISAHDLTQALKARGAKKRHFEYR